MLGSCLQAQQSIVNSVQGWLSPMGGSQVGPVIGWPFPQSLLHPYPYILVGRTDFESKVLQVGWCGPFSTGSPTWLQVSSGSTSPAVRGRS